MKFSLMLCMILLYVFCLSIDDDYIIVETEDYYDKYSYKDNWATSWKDSDVWQIKFEYIIKLIIIND